MTIHCGIGARRRRDGRGDEVARVVFKGRGSGGGVSTRVSSLCSILRAVGFSLWKAQRACLFVARKLSFTIWAILHASLLQMEKKILFIFLDNGPSPRFHPELENGLYALLGLAIPDI